MREKLKSIEYFDQYIERKTDDIEFYKKTLETPLNFRRDFSLLWKTCHAFLKTTSAQYSRGDDLETVADSFASAIAALPALHEKRKENPEKVFTAYNAYNDHIAFLSLAILFQPTNSALKSIFNQVVFFEPKDMILDTMLQSLGNELQWPAHTTILWPEKQSLA